MNTKSISVMVIDDDNGMREMMELVLKDLHDRNEVEKYEIAHSAEKAWARLKMQDGKFDVIITDVNMTGVSGIELVKMVKEEFPDINCIIWSGRDYLSEAKKNGALFFFKPYNPYELLDMAREVTGAK